MSLTFYKYQGTGNDFIMIDNRSGIFDASNLEAVRELCDRRFGIGADGLILIENDNALDFNMIYFNADGSKSFCGNGSRCAVAFSKYLGIIDNETRFLSTDGEHEATIGNDSQVALKMHDVTAIEKGDDYYYINTGSPHYIVASDDLSKVDVKTAGAAIRYNDRFRAEGTNVNFVHYSNDVLSVRTYERGVEDETLSCGTGVTAAVLSIAHQKDISSGNMNVSTLGGKLQVSFVNNTNGYQDIWLIGPADFVFKGEIMV